MASKKNVYDIFQTMETASKKYVTDEGQEWLKEYKKRLDDESAGKITSKKSPKITGPLHWKSLLTSAVNDLKSDLLIQILSETICNVSDAIIIVNNLYKDFHYYLETTKGTEFYSHSGKIILEMKFEDLFILGRLIGPLLIVGISVEIVCCNNLDLIYFFDAVGDILNNWIPNSYLSLKRSELILLNDRLAMDMRGGNMIERYTPMVILEYSDLDSALDDLIEFSCTGDGKIYWSVTHAYIQESIFDTVIEKLQQLTKEKIKRIQFIRCNEKEKLRKNLSSEDNNLQVFIAWDPRELDQECDLLKSVTLLPFRTINEVTSLINSRNSACAASIWTDKLSIANRLSKLLQVGTVWINSHGLLHPSVPFEFSSCETWLPENGMRIVECNCEQCPEKEVQPTNPPDRQEETKISSPFLRQSIEEAINCAEQGYRTLKRMEEKEIISILENISSNVNITETLDHRNILLNISSKGNVIIQPTKNIDVLSFSEPYKIIFMDLPEEYADIFIKILYCSLATKNTLIIRARPETLVQLSETLKSLSLPEGFINFIILKNLCLVGDKGINCHYSKGKFEMQEIDRHYYNCNYLYSLFLRKKTVWFPIDNC